MEKHPEYLTEYNALKAKKKKLPIKKLFRMMNKLNVGL